MTKQLKRFENKVALVTGGRSGIGRAIVRRLRDEGATVITTQHGEDEEFDCDREAALVSEEIYKPFRGTPYEFCLKGSVQGLVRRSKTAGENDTYQVKRKLFRYYELVESTEMQEFIQVIQTLKTGRWKC